MRARCGCAACRRPSDTSSGWRIGESFARLSHTRPQPPRLRSTDDSKHAKHRVKDIAMTRRARLWITGATTSDHSRAQHRAPVLTCRPSRPALGRRPERQRPSRHGGDGIAFLDVLAAQLRARGWSAYITTPAGPVASLFVQDPHDHPKSGDIIAALDGATGHWWYWFSWAERIAPAHAPAAAADTIIRALQRPADEPESPGPAASSHPPGSPSESPRTEPAEPITPGCNPVGTSLAVTRQRYRPRRDSRSARSDRLP
jgi:hypothetical protein